MLRWELSAIDQGTRFSLMFETVPISTGTIQGSLQIPRGFIEFAADESTPFHNKALSKDQEIILVCGAGGMAALTGKTMIEMGYKNVKNVGGIGDWIKAEGPVEK